MRYACSYTSSLLACQCCAVVMGVEVVLSVKTNSNVGIEEAISFSRVTTSRSRVFHDFAQYFAHVSRRPLLL
jgi:hypothetical protein